jgi:lipopolysaccharide export system permease protein
MQPSRYTPLSVFSRYLIRQFLGLWVGVTALCVLLYLLVDFFDRLDILLRHNASAGAATRYFVFKIPLIFTQITPAAIVTATLLSFGLMARRNEIIALRASGVSLLQTAVPMLATALTISVAVLAWNETVVPYCTRRLEHVNNVEIRKRTQRGILSEREVWYHGADGFYNIDHVDKGERTIYGLTIFRLDERFHLDSVILVPKAHWVGDRWVIEGAVERRLVNGKFTSEKVSVDRLSIPESLDDFSEVRRRPEEMSFNLLRDWILRLTRKGIDVSEYLVDLHLKIAVPFANAVLALIAIPIAGRVRRNPSLAAIVGLGVAVGFAYWVILALANSLGHSGTLPPLVAAWSANGLFLLVGIALFLYLE